MTSKQVRSLGVDSMTVKFPCHRERKRGDPTEKVRGIYSALYSKGLPQSLRSFAMTVGFPCHRERKRGDPTEELKSIYSSLGLWDISLTFNMTYFLFYVILLQYFYRTFYHRLK